MKERTRIFCTLQHTWLKKFTLLGKHASLTFSICFIYHAWYTCTLYTCTFKGKIYEGTCGTHVSMKSCFFVEIDTHIWIILLIYYLIAVHINRKPITIHRACYHIDHKYIYLACSVENLYHSSEFVCVSCTAVRDDAWIKQFNLG